LTAGIRQAVDDSRVTYTLGFYPPPEALDGKFHELRVEVKRKDVELRSRRGYLATPDLLPSPERLKTEVADAIGGPLEATGVRLKASLFRIPEAKAGTIRVVVDVSPSDLSLEQKGDRWSGGLHVMFVQLTASGHTLDSLNDVVGIDMDRAQYEAFRNEGMTLAKDLSLKRELDQIRVVVVDRPSGKVGSVGLRIPGVGGPAR
jgi:hypothetical protein